MLFALTGEIQTGKTRWLDRTVQRLSDEGVRCAGVIAPGVWRRRDPGAEPSAGERAVGSNGASEFEKLGIDNVLLPDGERVSFARRVDLAQAAGSFDEASQSARAGLGWAIDDGAIARVNAHFERLACEASGSLGSGDRRRSLLVVDELGRLELIRGEGLTAAMALLDRGPMEAFPHALVVVRADLVHHVRLRFEPIWGAVSAIGPGDAGMESLRAAFGVDPRC